MPMNGSGRADDVFFSEATTSQVAGKTAVHVEVRVRGTFNVALGQVREQIKAFILEKHREGGDRVIRCEAPLEGWTAVPFLNKHVEHVRVCESSCGQARVPIEIADVIVHAYYAAADDDLEELMTSDADPRGGGGGENGDAAGGEEDAMAATVLELPNAGLDGIWESLIYADDVKVRLLKYIFTTLRYSDANVDLNIIGWNRLLLLHGPPGTGKTSLCRALAHKLSVRLNDRFAYGKLVEINAHSLFSKWFSESGKLVQRLFSLIGEMVADEDGLIVVLIDEVESLTAARSNAASSGAEPGDAVRVVNALLTQLDKLKQRKNVLVVTTSNLSETVDNAFLDRADIKQYIGPPPPQAIYWILRSCLAELMRVRLIEEEAIVIEWNEALSAPPSSVSLALTQLATQAHGLSGRTLRRLPVLAHARYLTASTSLTAAVSVAEWIVAMQRALLDARQDLSDAGQGSRKLL